LPGLTEKQALFVLRLEEALQLTNPNEWHLVTTAEVNRKGGRGWLKHYGGSLKQGIEYRLYNC
jgi:hypothetical protein